MTPTPRHLIFTAAILYAGIPALNAGNDADSVRSVELKELSVGARRAGRTVGQSALIGESLNRGELIRAACCNLGESFSTNPSVDVSYTDAATGARQIRLLGLSGTYVQMLTENLPAFRGAAAPYSLGYVPGPWMQSIQVSKGSASVKNGAEAISGQINIEYLKPQADEAMHINLYTDTDLKIEANFDGNIHFPKTSDGESGPWSTSILAHYENSFRDHDGNHDGFMDKPRVEQLHLVNRWARVSQKNIFQTAINFLTEDRRSGQHGHNKDNPYRIKIRTDRAEFFAKDAVIFNQENASNIALMASGSLHKLDATYGHRKYSVDQWNAYLSLMYETNLPSQAGNISAGLSLNHDAYENETATDNGGIPIALPSLPRETTAGIYAQYTYILGEKLTAMAGLRADHPSHYGWFVTPRAHIKYTPIPQFSLRGAAGKGYRTNHVLAENNYLLASSRALIIAQDLKQEEAWNFGFSANTDFRIAGRPFSASAEYYYTRFSEQIVVDFDSDPHAVIFSNLTGRSFSHTLQLEANYELFDGFNLTCAWRLNDARSDYGEKGLRQRPLTPKWKGLASVSYRIPPGLWQIDLTLQYNGSGRMPDPYTLSDGTSSWPATFKAFGQLSGQVTRFFRWGSIYAGGENLTGFKQKNAIISAADPWSGNFDSTMIWGPLHGAMAYAGIRININR